MSGRALIALVAVVAMALVAVGLGVLFVTSGDDDGGTASETSGPAGASAPATEAPGSGSSPSVAVGAPETEPGNSLDLSTSSSSVPGLPPELGTEGLAPPDGFPQPDGAAIDELTGGLTVPGEAAAARSFYEGALPGEGYTVGSADLPGVAGALAVTGDGVSGQLVFLDLGFGSTSVFWVAS